MSPTEIWDGRAPYAPSPGRLSSEDYFGRASFESDNVDFTSMSAIVEDMADIFPELSPRDGKDAILKAIVAVFPNMADFDIIDTVQAHGKSKFIKKGLMLGQFYPGCLEPGLWNDDFRPLDAPLPMLAVRQMVSTDYPFLTARSEWMAAYLKRFAPTVPSPARAFIVAKMGS